MGVHRRPRARPPSSWMAGASGSRDVYRDVRKRDGTLRGVSCCCAEQRAVPLTALPISLNGEKISALVVGGGAVGTRKALTLSASGATVKVIAPKISAELLEAAETGLLAIEQREYLGSTDIGSCQVIVAATDSRDVNAMVASDAHALCRLVSIADAPTDGSFISMAVHRAGSVAIGVSAGNVPSAAGRIRDAIAARFDERYGDAVAGCAELRSKVLQEQGTAGWSKIHPGLIGSDFCARVENATFSEELAACRS